MEAKSILLVEDNPDDITLTLRALGKNNITNKIEIARDGEEAIKLISSFINDKHIPPTPIPALVLLDLKLPKVDGLEVLKFIRSNVRTKFLPVVILTSSKEEQDLFNSYNLGANSYIRKPVDFNNFIEAIKNLGLYWLLLNETPSIKE